LAHAVIPCWGQVSARMDSDPRTKPNAERVVEGGTWQGGTVTQKDAEICSVKDDRHGEKAEATLSIYQSD